VTETTYLPDVNVLFAAHVQGHPHHDIALSWLRAAGRYATCGTTEHGMIRLLSNPAANPDVTTAQAMAALTALRGRRQHSFWRDDTSLAEPLIDTARMTRHKQVTDFHLLNLAAHHDGVLVTLDGKLERALAPADRKHILTLQR
jgi:toxin-antitoxin system PIN domain toxin